MEQGKNRATPFEPCAIYASFPANAYQHSSIRLDDTLFFSHMFFGRPTIVRLNKQCTSLGTYTSLDCVIYLFLAVSLSFSIQEWCKHFSIELLHVLHLIVVGAVGGCGALLPSTHTHTHTDTGQRSQSQSYAGHTTWIGAEASLSTAKHF